MATDYRITSKDIQVDPPTGVYKITVNGAAFCLYPDSDSQSRRYGHQNAIDLIKTVSSKDQTKHSLYCSIGTQPQYKELHFQHRVLVQGSWNNLGSAICRVQRTSPNASPSRSGAAPVASASQQKPVTPRASQESLRPSVRSLVRVGSAGAAGPFPSPIRTVTNVAVTSKYADGVHIYELKQGLNTHAVRAALHPDTYQLLGKFFDHGGSTNKSHGLQMVKLQGPSTKYDLRYEWVGADRIKHFQTSEFEPSAAATSVHPVPDRPWTPRQTPIAGHNVNFWPKQYNRNNSPVRKDDREFKATEVPIDKKRGFWNVKWESIQVSAKTGEWREPIWFIYRGARLCMPHDSDAWPLLNEYRLSRIEERHYKAQKESENDWTGNYINSHNLYLLAQGIDLDSRPKLRFCLRRARVQSLLGHVYQVSHMDYVHVANGKLASVPTGAFGPMQG